MLEFVICLNMVLTVLANVCVLNGMSSPQQHKTTYISIYNYMFNVPASALATSE